MDYSRSSLSIEKERRKEKSRKRTIRKEASRFVFRNIETQWYTVVGQRFNKDRSHSQQSLISTPLAYTVASILR